MIIDPTILTVSGKEVSILNPDPGTIDIKDIAHALSHINRFTGHTAVPYTVAEHSLRVSSYLKAQGYTPASQLAGLLHDASEAYLGDVSTPLKQLLPDYKQIELNFERVIELRFGVVFIDRPEVKAADIQLLSTECRALMPRCARDWPIIKGLDPDNYGNAVKTNTQWGNRSRDELIGWFLKRYNQLNKEIVNAHPQY